jgi:thiamine-monophosphate kinase
MCDVSDGLLADLAHICDASGIGATVALQSLPLSPAAQRAAGDDRDLPARLAAAGDDYELVFAAPPDASGAIGRLAAELGLAITAIGTMEKGEGVRLIDAGGKRVPVVTAGYRHS